MNGPGEAQQTKSTQDEHETQSDQQLKQELGVMIANSDGKGAERTGDESESDGVIFGLGEDHGVMLKAILE